MNKHRLEEKLKRLFFSPVHIDHQNYEPHEIKITKDGIDYYTEQLIEVITSEVKEAEVNGRTSELAQIISNGKAADEIVIYRFQLENRIRELQEGRK